MKIKVNKNTTCIMKGLTIWIHQIFGYIGNNSKCTVFMFQSVLEELVNQQSAQYFYLSLFFTERGLSAVVLENT